MNYKYARARAALCVMLAVAALTGCGNATPERNASLSEMQSSSQAQEAQTPEKAPEIPDKIESSQSISVSSESSTAQAVDLSDLEAVTEAYINPLIWCGPLWSYTWETPSQIESDDLLAVFGYNNFLDLPKDFEGSFSPEDAKQPAEKVEPILEKYFGVSDAYLKTSQFYNADTDTYDIPGGFGGGWNAVATSAEQQGDTVTIHVAILSPVSDDEKTPDMVFASDGRALLPGGTLTLKPGNDGFDRYLSFVRDDG